MTFSHPDYTIVRALGRGGSASVYLAVQNNLNRRVALKVMHSAALHDPNVGKRFLREARIVAKLSHPRIVPIYEVGQPTDTHGYYLSMEYLPGGSLTSRAGSLSLGEFRVVLSQIVDALAHAHENGFVHRDVKPDNILFRSPTDALLADFGIARLSQSTTSLTATGAMIGTPDYMSPEQIQGLAVDARTDLYQLGLVMFELLAGYRPYRGDSMMNIGFQHLTAPVPLLPAPSAHFQPCINRLLAKKPNERPASAREFLETFDSLYKNSRSSPETPLSELHAHDDGEAMPTMDLSNIVFSSSQLTEDQEPSPRPRRFQSRSRVAGIAITVLVVLLGADWYWQGAFIPDALVRGNSNELAGPDKTQGNGASLTSNSQAGMPDSDNPQAGAQEELTTAAMATSADAEKIIDAEISSSDAEKAIDANTSESEAGILTDSITGNSADELTSAEPAVSLDETEGTRDQQIKGQAETAFQRERWFGEEADTATRVYQQLSTIVPDSEIANDRLAQIFNSTQARFERAIEQGNLSEAKRQLEYLHQAWPEDSRTEPLTTALAKAWENERQRMAAAARRERIRSLLTDASAAMQAGRWQTPEGNSALSHYRTVLELEPDNALAQAGLVTLVEQIEQQVFQAISNKDFAGAQGLIDSAQSILPDHAAIGRSQIALTEGQEHDSFNAEIDALSRRVDAWLGNETAQLDGVYAGLKDDLTTLLQNSPDNVDLRRLQIATERQVSLLQRLNDDDDAASSDPFHIPGF